METFIPRGRITGPILPSFVLRENISPGAKMLYALLCNHASDKDHCWPSHRFLAQELHKNLAGRTGARPAVGHPPRGIPVFHLCAAAAPYRGGVHCLRRPGQEGDKL